MTESIKELPNSKAKLQESLQAGRITWKWPLILVFARLIFAVLAQGLVAGLFMLQGHPTPFQAAAPWWPVYGTLIDIGCLVLLARLAHKEGIRLWDLINFQRQRLGRDLLLGLGVGISIVTLSFVGFIIFDPLIYGATPAPIPHGALPLWGVLYALLVWPIIWGLAEELTYQGYALPRLEVLSGRTWLAVIIVGFGWALQHSALPLMPDWRWTVYRFATNIPIVVIMIFYLRTRPRRLFPFIFGHWAANFFGILVGIVLPMMTP
ncbi:MAG: CPBP family intramembrane metalloprotease [Deltaproteobacteria bacterium]|nr:CPBP family intramembrane metalloprotease [Deltaproteobacteria bacterium]